MVEDQRANLSDQAFSAFFSPFTVVGIAKVSIASLAHAVRASLKLWSILAVGLEDKQEGRSQIVCIVVAENVIAAKERAKQEVRKSRKITNHTKFYFTEITDTFLEMLSTVNVQLNDYPETEDQDFLLVEDSKIPNFSSQIRKSLTSQGSGN